MTSEDKAILWRALAGKHGFGGLLQNEVFERFERLANQRFGREIQREVSDGLFWGLKSPEASVRADARAFLNKAGWVRPVLRWGQRRMGLTKPLPGGVSEVSDIEPLTH